MENKNSFIIYYDTMEILDDLTDEQAGKLFKAIKAFEMDGELPEFKGEMKMLWIPFKNALLRARKKWKEKCDKARRAALKRWARENGKILPPPGEPTDEYFDSIQTNTDVCERIQTNAKDAEPEPEPEPLSEKN